MSLQCQVPHRELISHAVVQGDRGFLYQSKGEKSNQIVFKNRRGLLSGLFFYFVRRGFLIDTVQRKQICPVVLPTRHR